MDLQLALQFGWLIFVAIIKIEIAMVVILYGALAGEDLAYHLKTRRQQQREKQEAETRLRLSREHHRLLIQHYRTQAATIRPDTSLSNR